MRNNIVLRIECQSKDLPSGLWHSTPWLKICYSGDMLISRKGELLWKILSTIGNASIAFSSHPSRNSLSVYRALRDLKALQAASDRQLRTISKYVVDKKYIRIERSPDGVSTISVSVAGKTI